MSDKKYKFEQFAAIRRYGGGSLSFSPDGAEVAYTVNTSGQYNLWKQSTLGGFPHQLTTFSDRTVRTVSWSPDGKWIAFNADQNGDEFHQIYIIPSQGGWPQQLTSVMDAQFYLGDNGPWSPDGRYLAYYANDRERANMDVSVWDMETQSSRRVFQGEALYAASGWSPDGKLMLVGDFKSNTNMDIYLVNAEDGSGQLLTEHDEDTIYAALSWKADGSGFYLLSNENREFNGLGYYDLGKKAMSWVEDPAWDVEGMTSTKDGRLMAWLVNEDGYSKLHLRDTQKDELLDLPAIPQGTMISLTFSPDGNKLGMFITTPASCAEIFVLDIPEKKISKITYSMLGGIDEQDMVLPEIIRYTSFDGREIPAFLFRPKNVSARDKVPVVLSIHGGPEAQERPSYPYSGLYQYWLNRGIGVLATNIRGSSGYGISYQTLIHRDWGGDELKDIEHAAKYLQLLDWVNADKLGVFGGSFGGFATLSAVSRLPDYWAAGVDVVGPSNLVTFIKAVPPHWVRFMDQWVGNPEDDYDMLVARSPITYVDQIKAPLFIIQGAKDPRVVKDESDQMVEALRQRGVDVKYDVYEDEGHGFTRRSNELKAWKDTALFMEEKLLG